MKKDDLITPHGIEFEDHGPSGLVLVKKLSPQVLLASPPSPCATNSTLKSEWWH